MAAADTMAAAAAGLVTEKDGISEDRGRNIADAPTTVPTSLTAGATATPGYDLAALAGRKIIRNGSVELRVDAAASTLRKAEQIVMAHGGFVADQQASYDRGADVTVVYRVPSKEFDSVLRGLSGLGTLINAQVSSNEVTGQVVDLEARLRSKKAAADRLRILVGQATKPADVLAIEAELANREADIESMSAQLNGLNDQVSLSTIRAHIFTPVTGPVSTPSAKPGFSSGWHGGVDAVRRLGNAVAVTLGAVLPFLPLGLLVAAIAMLIRRRWFRTDRHPHAPVVADQTTTSAA